MPPPDATESSPDAIILGAGVGGALTARIFAESGLRVVVVDPAPPAPNATPRRGALYVRPAVDYSPETRFAHQAFLAASAFYSRLQAEHPGNAFWYPTGTLSLAWNEREQHRQSKLLARNRWDPAFLQPVSAESASSLSGLDVNVPGLWFPAGGHLRVDSLRRTALDHPLVSLRVAAAHTGNLHEQPDGRWHLELPDGDRVCAGTLICATGAATREFAHGLPLGAIRGQLTTLPVTRPVPRVALSGAGYALPPLDGRVCLGATFDRESDQEAADPASDQTNLDTLSQWLPALTQLLGTARRPGQWVGFRSTTPDHMPVAGHWEGLTVLAGMGGKGLVYAPILAHHLAAAQSGAPSPIEPELERRLSPARFLGR